MNPRNPLLRYGSIAGTAALALAGTAALLHPSAAHGSRQPAPAAAARRMGWPASPAVPAQLAAPAAKLQVNIDNFSFAPKTLTVPAGTTVTWTNHDDVPHTVVSTKKAFASPALDTNEKFSFRFTKPGTYPYYCSVHPMMTGTVVVK